MTHEIVGPVQPELNLPIVNATDVVRTPRARDVGAAVQNELNVLQALKANLQVHHEELDDPEVMLCLADGETSLFELLDHLLEADLTDDALISALKLSKDTLAARLHRLEERKRSRRAILEQALLLLQQRRLERPTATIVLADRPPVLVVEEVAQIPTRFFDLKPVLNKTLAKQALEAGEEVPGAKLSSRSISLTVKRR